MFEVFLTKMHIFADKINNNGVNEKWNRKRTSISENWEKVKKNLHFRLIDVQTERI